LCCRFNVLSLPNAKLAEDRIENLVHIHDTNDFADGAQRLIEINRNVFAGQAFAQGGSRAIA
jgi:hypothetical protein